MDMRKRFDEAILDLIAGKREDNMSLLTAKDYEERIASVKVSKSLLSTSGAKKSMKDYRMVKKYDILIIGGREKLIKPVSPNACNVLYYVTTEELFDILHSTHSDIGHGGRNRMVAEIKNKYCNISQEVIMAYLKLCVHCQKKSANPHKGVVSKPILHSAFNSRAQVDLIDMQSQSFNDFRFIMVYQDHLTKFVLLRPLKTKRSAEVASMLLDIYTTFGAPTILHSDNGREFVNSVLDELHSMWDGIKIVHGKPRHSQSQGSVERANRDVEEMLAAWMAENNCPDWPAGLKIVQFQKNRAFHSGIGRSPYEAMFGCPARVGLATTAIPISDIPHIRSEEDMEAAFSNRHSNETNQQNRDAPSNSSSGLFLETSGPQQMEIADILETPLAQSSDILCQACNMRKDEEDDICGNCKRRNNILKEREQSRECLEKQASKMLKSSNNKFSPVAVGSTVRIPIPDVDRARGAPRNLLAVVSEVDENNMYKLCTEEGTLKQKYARFEFNPCPENLLESAKIIANSEEKETTLREAASNSSIAGAQGYTRCQCKTKCTTKRCRCRTENRLCTSKCHGSRSCQNKNE